jgi:hypothetical protein
LRRELTKYEPTFYSSAKILVFFCLFLFLHGNFVSAQNDKWFMNLSGESIRTDDNGIPRVLFAEQYNSGFLVMREQVYRGFKKRRFFIEKLDNQLRTISQTEITSNLDEQRFDIEEVIRFNNRVLVISSELIRNDRSWVFYVQEVDFEKLALTQRVKIFEMQNESGPIRFDIQISPNQELILFSFIPFKRVPLVGKQENDYRYMVLMRADMESTLISERIDMTVDKIDFNVKYTLIDDHGTIFFLARKIADRKSEEPSFGVLRYKSRKLDLGKFVFKDGQIQNARIELNDEGNILFIGYYNELKRFNPGIGVVSTEFDKTSLEHYNVRFDLIKNDVLMNGLSDRQKRKAQREIEAGRDFKLNRDLVPLYFIRHPSGQISMVGEVQYQTFESSGVTQAGAINRIIYNYEHIFVTRIAQDGRILWSAKIPKLYRGSFDPIVTFQVVVHDEELNFVFNDNLDNLDPNPRRGVRPLSQRSTFNYLSRVTLTDKGKMTKNIILSYAESPFNRMNLFSLFTDVAKTNNQQLIFSTSGRMGYYYILVGRND